MIYSFQLLPHSNIRYRQAQDQLALKELMCLLSVLDIPETPRSVTLGGCTFLQLETEVLTERQLRVLSFHSLLLMIWQQENGAYTPIPAAKPSAFPEDLSEVLRYKGKTSPAFTRMMMNCALSAAGWPDRKITVLDPLAGRGTTLLCALEDGHDALGIESRAAEVREWDTYMGRYCTFHRFKHEREASSRTVRGRGVPVISYRLSADREAWKHGQAGQAVFAACDTVCAPELFRKAPPDIMVTDLPYGVQHAPSAESMITDFPAFLSRVLPAWRRTLPDGGALAMSFNTFTLKKADVLDALSHAGFTPLTEQPYDSFEHDVEQAVRRDFVVALAGGRASSKEVSL